MEQVSNENDADQIFKLMANYKTDKPIKISYVFEDSDSHETGIVESNSQLPNNQVQFSPSSQNKNNTNSTTAIATELLNTPLCDQNCYPSNVSFEDMKIGFNMERERCNNAEENYIRSFQNQQTANSYANSNNHLRQIENFTNQTLNKTNDWTSNEKMRYKNLLDTVSDNVIMVAKCYHYFNVKYAKTLDQNLKKYYQEHKVHYYHQSYNALVSAILPYEHSNAFIRNFIDRTVEIANRKSSCHSIYTRSLEPIILDMIRWAKHPDTRINQLQNQMNRPPATSLPPPYSAATRQPMNIQVPASLGPSIPTLPSSNGTRQRLSGPLVSQLSFNLPAQPPFYSVCNSNTHHPMRRAPPISVPPPQPPASNIFSSVNIRQQKSTLASVSLVPSDLPTPPPSASSLVSSILPEPHKSCSPINYNGTRHPVPREKVPELSASASSNRFAKSNANEQTLAENDTTICLFSNGPPGSEISISIDAEIAKALNDIESSNKVRKSSHNRTSKRQKTNIESPTLVYTSSTRVPATQFTSTQNLIQENNHNCYSPNQLQITSNAESVDTIMPPVINNPNLSCPGERQTHKENNEYHPSLLSRSESRDSGFGSPVLSALQTSDTVYPQCTDNQDSRTCTPEIAHVTSMNPEAVFIASGACKICGTITRNKCIACYNVYYCGTKCQTLDWPLHMIKCKTK